jgi:hypothetical protein
MKIKLLIVNLLLLCCFIQLNGQSTPSKKIHLVRMLDFFSDYSEENGYAMRAASNNIQAYFESNAYKLANDVTGGNIELHNVYDDLNTTQASHDPFRDRSLITVFFILVFSTLNLPAGSLFFALV